MNKAFAVAKWEYIEKVKSKAFLIGLLVTPLLMIGMGVASSLLASSEDEETKIIGIIDLNGEFVVPLSEHLQQYKLSNGHY